MSRTFLTIALALVATLAFAPLADAQDARSDPGFVASPRTFPPVAVGSDTCAAPAPPTTAPLPFVDGGDTCGNTDTVNSYTGGCALPFPYAGEDVIYQVDLGAGNNVSFSADLTGSLGDLALFLVSTCNDGTSCVANSQDSVGPGAGPEDIAAAAYAPGTYFLYVDSYYNAGAPGSCGTYTLTVAGTLPVKLQRFEIH